MSWSCYVNPLLCGAEAAGSSALDAVSDWWYGNAEDLAQTTVPTAEPLPDYLYPDSPIDVPSSPRTAAPSASIKAPASADGLTSQSSPSPAPKEAISPLWIGAGVVLLGAGGWYLYQRTV